MTLQNPSDEQFPHLHRHPKYSFSDGTFHLLVENQMFKVHRYFFERESCFFRDRLLAANLERPVMPGGFRNGDDESTAIIIPGIPASAFQKLLDVFYNETYSLYSDWTIEDWTIVLELALKWQFAQVFALAIREIEKQTMPVIERIGLYQRFDVCRDLLVPLYSVLCSRPEALSDRESEVIGRKTTVVVFRARERLRARPSDGGLSPLPDELEEGDVSRAIVTLLEESA